MNRPPRSDPRNIIGRVKNGSLDNIGVFRVIYLGRLHLSDAVKKDREKETHTASFLSRPILSRLRREKDRAVNREDYSFNIHVRPSLP
jgi:hypothetical protein